MAENALIIGVGDGLSASLARLLAKDGAKVGLAARHPDRLAALAQETGGKAYRCDVTERDEITAVFADAERDLGPLDLVVFNPSYRTRGAIVELDPDEVLKTLMITTFGGFLVAQEAAKRMLPRGKGTLLLTGASASVKGYAKSAPFAMAKFGLRGLAQSMARELQPAGIHVAHIVIDGGISKGDADPRAKGPDTLLHPDRIAESYLQLHRQHRSTWAWEIELRPWTENF